uniref:Hypoxia up-regulated protein 1 n=1 Tax=Gasterosteus aculeatus aculeatus TaxID=481459 RepID=A0AAQ4P283_GASAC
MERRMLAPFLLFSLVLAMLPSRTVTVAVMSIDLGSEWMKVAIVKPGVPMEIVLNKESRRKTPTAVCLKENERFLGDSALGMSVKNPTTVYRHLQGLLGKKYDNLQVALYQKRFPEHQLLEDPVRGTVYFKNSEEMQFTPEELLGMLLNYSRGLAQDFAEQPIKDAVITVPAFFNQAERRAVLQAAQMAGVKVLQLINDNTAVALNYGVFRRKDIDNTVKNVMFYDMGSGSTTATIVTYQTVKTKEAGTQPQLQIRGVGFDRGLGGFEMDLRLRDHLAKLFNEQKKSKKDVRENQRAMAKLLKEAQRLKTVLSANVDFMAQVEGLMDDIDFKAKVTRTEFEELCADLFERVPGPVQEALTTAEMKLEEIEQVILVGGSTRVPKVQEVLLKAVEKEELGKNINADEAAAMGAVYQAAALSKAFKVKPFLVRDAAIFPIQVEFTRETEEEGLKIHKHNKRVLFQRMAPYPQRKVITFNRYSADFAFYINYGDLSFLSQHDLSVFGSLNLTTVKLSGVGDSFQKHTDAESKGIKAHFNMDESGVLLLDREMLQGNMCSLSELGNTISTLFGGGSSEPSLNATEPVQEEVPPESEKDGKEEEGKAEGEKEEAAKEKQEEAEKTTVLKVTAFVLLKEEDGEKSVNAEAEKDAEKDAEKQTKPQKKSKIAEEITVELVINDILDPTNKFYFFRLQDLTDRDLAKQEREKSLNSLEAFIFETQDKLYQEDYQQVVSEEEKEQISSKLSEASEWMDEDGYAATTKQLREKLSQLKSLCKDMFFRVEERRKWPDRLALQVSICFRLLQKWKNETVAAQEKNSLTERPVLLSKDIESKLTLLDREVNYLLNKAKFAKPKAKAKAKNGTSSGKSSKGNNTEDKVIPPTEESTDTKTENSEEVQPGQAPPTEESTEHTGSDSQSQPTEETKTTAPASGEAQLENHNEL